MTFIYLFFKGVKVQVNGKFMRIMGKFQQFTLILEAIMYKVSQFNIQHSGKTPE